MVSPPFLEDIYPLNLLYAATIRSPAPKGKLINILIPELPGDYKLITARDIPGENRLEDTDMPVLTSGRVSYIGEPVAIIIGENKTKLEELVLRCKVIIEDDNPNENENENKIEKTREIKIGDAYEVFAQKGKIVTGSYNTGIQDHWYAEPVGAVTWRNDQKQKPAAGKNKTQKKNKNLDTDDHSSGLLIVRTATQWPYHVKRSVSRVLGIEPSSVSVEPSALNIHMDGKLWYPSLIACHAALGTFFTNRPIRLLLSKEDDFLYTPKRFESNIDIASSIDDNGKILASKIDISVNLGAYMVNSDEILDQVCLGCLGFYKFDNLQLTARIKHANIPPQGPFSGFGLAQGQFAIERHISQVADIINKDQAVWRINHADSKLIMPPLLKNNTPSEDLIKTAAKMSDYNRKWASYELLRQIRKTEKTDESEKPRGIGIALGYQSSGLIYQGEDKGLYSVEVTLTKDSVLEIRTSIESSEDYSKIWEKIAEETMAVKPEKVRIISDNAPDCGPSCSSRNITIVTKMVEKCCQAIKKQLFRDPLPITVKRSIKPQSGALRSGYIEQPAESVDINSFSKPGLAAAVVEVIIDPIEYIPMIRGIWLAVDGGKIISRNRARRSITRAVIQALGWSYIENIEYINGALPKEQYDHFKIISPLEIPQIDIEFLKTDNSEPKGVGELSFACIPAAFLQAVSQAADHCFKSIPIKRNDIWKIKNIKNEDAHHAAVTQAAQLPAQNEAVK